MTKIEINMNPSGVAWEKQDTCLVTGADVAHTCKGEKVRLPLHWTRKNIQDGIEKKLTEDFLTVRTEWWNQGFYVAVVEKEDPEESYISIIGKKFLGCGKIADYEEIYSKEKADSTRSKIFGGVDHVIDIHQPRELVDRNITVDVEARVYRDSKISLLCCVAYADGHKRYFCTSAEKVSLFHYNEEEIANEERLFNKTENPLIKEVFDEKDVRKYSMKNTKSTSILCIVFGSGLGSDLRNRALGNGKSFYRFDSALRAEINKFMGIDDPEIADIKKSFNDQYEYYKHDWRDTESGITSIPFLDAWTICSFSARVMAKKTLDDKSLWSTIHWGEENRSVTWERRTSDETDYIIASYQNKKSTWYPRVAFVYNVNKKTRKVLLERKVGGEVKAIIPSLKNAILNNFDFMPTYEYDCDSHDYVKKDDGPVQHIVDDISIKELFAKTNVSWILENEKEFGDDMFYLFADGASWRYSSTPSIRTIQEDIKEGGKIGVVALCILATTGNKMLEQLLKSRMFRLYFLGLKNEAEQDTIFWDTSKKVANRHDNCPFPYTSKGKNLKEMLGMSLNQLRMADKAVEIKEKKKHYYSSGSELVFEYEYPRFGGVTKVLGIEKLNALDDKLFKAIIEETKHRVTDDWGSSSMFVRLTDMGSYDGGILDCLEHNTPKQRLEWFQTIKGGADSSGIYVFRDYLRMRKSMKDLQAAKPAEEIFTAEDEKTYPIKPGRAVKFIRFMPGMRVDSGWYSSQSIDTPDEFVKFIKDKYAKFATEKGSVQLELNEFGHVAGAIVKMNSIQHIAFLHNELSRWFATYGNDERKKEFAEASKRVAGLCWSDDEDTGLCITRPTTPGELRKEGGILSHCVASYVDPIIAGSHNIMFIRRCDMKDEPYYTLDINENGEVVEVHGYMNYNMDESDIDKSYAETGREVYAKHFDIKKFLHNWASAMKGKVKDKSIRNSYGKLDIIA